MTIRDDARQEAERRRPSNHLVDDPFGETGEAWSDPYGYNEEAQRAFIEGAVWASEQPDREPSDADVRAALSEWYRGIFSGGWTEQDEARMRAALLAAQETRDHE